MTNEPTFDFLAEKLRRSADTWRRRSLRLMYLNGKSERTLDEQRELEVLAELFKSDE